MDLKRWLLAVLVLLALSFPIGATPARAALPPGNAVKDPTAILRNALPINQPDLQELQHRLESTSDDLRAKRWTALTSTARRSQTLLSSRRQAILDSLPAQDQSQGSALLDQLETEMQAVAAAAEVSDRDGFLNARRSSLSSIGQLEALLVGDFPF
jgi:peptidylprolyl isomerase